MADYSRYMLGTIEKPKIPWDEIVYTFLQETQKKDEYEAIGVKSRSIMSLRLERFSIGTFSEWNWYTWKKMFQPDEVPYWGILNEVGKRTYKEDQSLLIDMWNDVYRCSGRYTKRIVAVLFG